MFHHTAGKRQTGKGVPRFLNRILGLESVKQNLLFECFLNTHDTLVRRAKRDGTYYDAVVNIRGPSVYFKVTLLILSTHMHLLPYPYM